MAKETNPNEPQEAETTPEAEPQEQRPDDFAGFDGGQLLLDLMADPDIQKVLAAKREGQALRISASAEPEPEPEPEPIDALKELEDYDEDLKKVATAIVSQIDGRLDPVTRRLEVLESLAQTMQKQTVDNQIQAVAKKYPDFAKYRRTMAELARQEGLKGLGVEELFLIAKHKAGDLSLTEPSTHSERPTPTPRRKLALDKKEQPERGRRAFQVTLADALDNLDLPSR